MTNSSESIDRSKISREVVTRAHVGNEAEYKANNREQRPGQLNFNSVMETELDIIEDALTSETDRLNKEQVREFEDADELERIRREIGIQADSKNTLLDVLSRKGSESSPEIEESTEQNRDLNTECAKIFDESVGTSNEAQREPLSTRIERFSTNCLSLMRSENFWKGIEGMSEGERDKMKTFIEQLDQFITENSQNAIAPDSINKNISNLLNLLKSNIDINIANDLFDAVTAANSLTNVKNKFGQIARLGMDFIPIYGPAKMLQEAYKGTALDGTKLVGWRRGMHALQGGCFLLLDLTGTGALLTKGKTGSVIGAKLFKRSAALARKLGVGQDIYRPLFAAGQQMTKNRLLSQVLDEGFKYLLEARKSARVK